MPRASTVLVLLRLMLAGLLVAAMPALAPAQEPTTATPVALADQKAVIDRLSRQVDDLQRRIETSRDDDARLTDLRLELDDVSRQLIQAAVSFRPRVTQINARLEQIGPAPGENDPPEPQAVTDERKALTTEKSEINALIGIAEQATVKASQLTDLVGSLRRDLFARTLSKRYEINGALFAEVAEEFQTEAQDIYRTISSWVRFVYLFKWGAALTATFLALSAAAILMIGGRKLFGRFIVADPAREAPSYLSRLSVAFWSTLIPSASLAVFFAATYYAFDYGNVLRGDIGAMMVALFTMLAITFFVHRLATAVLTPSLPAWRLDTISSGRARSLVWLMTATAFLTTFDVFLSTIYEIMGSPLSLTVGESLVATVLVGILVIAIGAVRPVLRADGTVSRYRQGVRWTLYILGALTVIAALLGFLGFARFLAQQIVVTGAIAAMMYIGFQSGRAVSDDGAFGRTALGKVMTERSKLDATTLDQLGLVSSIAIHAFVLVVGLPLILLQWGFQWGDIRSWTYQVATEIRVGSVSFSLIGILTGIGVFVIGYFATRWFQSWLDGRVMARGRMDPGVRNSIRTAVGYAGVGVAALIGISAAGIGLANLALVAGALSLGIGFGLQNIVSNFVSGLILLAERPFKVGDWIVAGDVSGTVRKISVRATEIETFQRQTVILPNSQLINAAVGNWTHKNKLGRVDIKVMVTYDSDVKKVQAVLLDIARQHPLVLRNPEPFTVFLNFGEWALEFELRMFLADITSANTIHNDVRTAILERFPEEGIRQLIRSP